MLVWIFESNLLWSSRFVNSIRAFGHESLVVSQIPEGTADAAIVNLSDPNIAALATALKERGVYTIAHAGHKEKDLIELGKQIQVDRIATNGEITKKLESLLVEAQAQSPRARTLAREPASK